MSERDVRTSEEQDWDNDVQKQIATLGKVIRWSEKWENWGDKEKDWHTELTSGRIRHYLELATLELYDLQYIKPEKEVLKWRERQYTDRKRR